MKSWIPPDQVRDDRVFVIADLIRNPWSQWRGGHEVMDPPRIRSGAGSSSPGQAPQIRDDSIIEMEMELVALPDG